SWGGVDLEAWKDYLDGSCNLFAALGLGVRRSVHSRRKPQPKRAEPFRPRFCIRIRRSGDSDAQARIELLSPIPQSVESWALIVTCRAGGNLEESESRFEGEAPIRPAHKGRDLRTRVRLVRAFHS